MKKPTQREQMAYSTIARLEAELDQMKAASGWIKCSDRLPPSGETVVVWRKWPHWNCFGAELDAWEGSADEGDWYAAEESCQHIETCADGPGHVQRPETSYWCPLPAPPTE